MINKRIEKTKIEKNIEVICVDGISSDYERTTLIVTIETTKGNKLLPSQQKRLELGVTDIVKNLEEE